MSTLKQGDSRYAASGFEMINSFRIEHFRGFERLEIDGPKRLNLNGSGKTALLEAMFLALGSSTELALRFRQNRGLEGQFFGDPRMIQDSIFGDLFHQRDYSRSVRIDVSGDSAYKRSVSISKGPPQPLMEAARQNNFQLSPPGPPGHFVFVWTDANGMDHHAIPIITPAGPQFAGSGEHAPSCFYYPANQAPSSLEAANLFSTMSRTRREGQFIEIFTREFDWIEGLSIEVTGGSPAIHAAVKGSREKLPITLVSGAINRLITVMLSVASFPKGVVLIDELENGVFHKHHVSLWRSLISLCREYDTQVFTTTHSEEWLEALIHAAGDDVSDLALWRVEGGEGHPIVRQFSGKTFKAGVETGGEVRG